MVDFEPSRGNEIQKARPAVVVSSIALNKLGIRMVVPISTFKPKHDNRIWVVSLSPTKANGLEAKSAFLPEQCRCVTVERFQKYLGYVPQSILSDLEAALKIILDFE